jgi:hypothetical protein
MVKIAEIVNRYGKSYMVPLYKAKEMVRNEEIEDYDIIEVARVKNFQKPQTQKEFERGLAWPKTIAEQENEVLREQITLLQQKKTLENVKTTKAPELKGNEVFTKPTDEIKTPDVSDIYAQYVTKFGNDVPNNKKNDVEWIKSKLVEVKKPTLN